jgi:hypothetical protein
VISVRAAVESDAGYGRAVLWVLRDNPPARRFYEKCGWEWRDHVRPAIRSSTAERAPIENPMELLPSSMSFRIITTLDIADESEIPAEFAGRVRRPFEDRSKYIAWYTDGLLNNPTRSYPAYRRFRSNGQVKYELHYTNGMLQDPGPSSPAVRGYFANGMIHYEERYEQGRRQDGADGAAAVRKWRADGTLRHELRYRDGQRLPS